MIEGNYLCETEKCGNSATGFGLRGTFKIRSCDKHVASLISKRMAVYGIDGYEFILNPQDAAEFDERKAVVDKGLGALEVLDGAIGAEHTAALQLLETVKKTLLARIENQFSEIERSVAKRRSELKEKFAFLAANLQQYPKRREHVLLQTATLLCGEIKATPAFISLVVAGLSDAVSQAFSKNWSVSTAGVEAILSNAVFGMSEPPTAKTASAYNQKGLKSKQAKEWKEAEKSYLQAKAIYELCAPRSTDAATNLANLGVLCNETQRWDEAEEWYRRAQAIFDRTDPQCDEAARNQNNYGKQCFQLQRREEAEQHYQQAKRICESAGKPTVSLAFALSGLGNLRKDLQKYSEAAEFYTQAQRVFDTADSKSAAAALNDYNLGYVFGELKQWKDSEENYKRAKRICEGINPQSTSCANCMHNLGLVYEAQNRIEESAASLQAAAELYALNNCEELKSKAEKSILRVQAKRNREIS